MIFEICHALHEEEIPRTEETFLSRGKNIESVYL